MLGAQTHCLEPTLVCCRFYALTGISNFLFLAARRQSSWKRAGFPAQTNTLARLSRRECPCGSEIRDTWLEGLPKAAPGLDERICSMPVFHQAGLHLQEIPQETSERWRGCSAQQGISDGVFLLEIQLRFHIGRWGGSDETTEGVSASGLLWVLSSGICGFGEFRLSEHKVNGEERPQPFLQESWQIWAGNLQFMQSEYILGGMSAET